MREFADLIEEVKARIGKVENQSEASARYHLIDPVLRHLGWTDPEHIKLEEVQKDHLRRDYMLYHDKKQHIVIEAKGVGKIGSDTAEKALTYCHNKNVPYFVTTDGNEWKMYDIYKKAELEGKAIMSCNLSEDSTIDACRKLLALWRYKGELKPKVASVPVTLDVPSKPPEPFSARGVALPSYNHTKNKKPQSIIFPDGTEKSVNGWRDFHSEVIRWLIDKGRLRRADCPVVVGRSYLVNTEPKTPSGASFLAPKQIGFVYYDANRNAEDHRDEVVALVKKLHLDPKKFKITLQE